jgi:hypothetical protein
LKSLSGKQTSYLASTPELNQKPNTVLKSSSKTG